MCKQKQDIFVIQKEIFKTVTIETVIDSVKDNLPIIAGIVGVGVVIYLVWSNWPPRKGPNKAPDKPDKPDDSDKPLRTKIRNDITLKYGEDIKQAFEKYKTEPVYEKLDPAIQRALDEKYAALYNDFYEALSNKMFYYAKKWNKESMVPQQTDYNAILDALQYDVLDISEVVDAGINIYHNTLESISGIPGAEAPVYRVCFDRNLPSLIMNSISILKNTPNSGRFAMPEID